MVENDRKRSTLISWVGAIWVLVGLVLIPPFALSIMAFDAPDSGENYRNHVWVFAMFAIPILTIMGGILTFWKKRAVYLLLPLVGALLVSAVNVFDMLVD
jgi:MFS family permease